MALHIKTNGQTRPLLYWPDLTPKEQRDNDWAEGRDGEAFIRYRGDVVALEQFSRLPVESGSRLGFPERWDGYSCDTYGSGLCIQIVRDGEGAIVGAWYQTSID